MFPVRLGACLSMGLNATGASVRAALSGAPKRWRSATIQSERDEEGAGIPRRNDWNGRDFIPIRSGPACRYRQLPIVNHQLRITAVMTE